MSNGRSRSTSLGRLMELVGLSLAIVAAFGAGVWFSPWPPPWSVHPGEGPPSYQPAASQTDAAKKAVVAPATPRTEDPPQPEPRAVEARANAIRRDAAEIEAEAWALTSAPGQALLAEVAHTPSPGPAAIARWRKQAPASAVAAVLRQAGGDDLLQPRWGGGLE